MNNQTDIFEQANLAKDKTCVREETSITIEVRVW